MISKLDRRPLIAALLAFMAPLATGCGNAETAKIECPPQGDKWLRRAQQSYQIANVDEARDEVQKALALCPVDDVRLLAGRVALSRLDYAEALRLLKGVPGTSAAGLRGRALWYKGELDAAADELDRLLDDPDVHDDWAKSISKLARMGAGRTPFATSGALLAAVDMPHVSPTAPVFVVPIEVDGESALAMVATGTPEVVLDSATRKEPSWVSLRFDGRFEVSDVPALAQDLSGLSKQVGAPIKVLLGVNLLRRLNVTLDYTGRQFVVRTFDPPKPPSATRVDLAYVRGGGMILGGAVGTGDDSKVALLVDTSMSFPVALDKDGWKKAGFDAEKLTRIADDPEQRLREGVVSTLHLGAFDIPRVPSIYGAPHDTMERALDMDLDGIVGAGLIGHFRVTYGDGGRFLWLEEVRSGADGRPRAPSEPAPSPGPESRPAAPATPPPTPMDPTPAPPPPRGP